MLSIGIWLVIAVAVLYPIGLICLGIESKATLVDWFWALTLLGLVIVAALVLSVLCSTRE